MAPSQSAVPTSGDRPPLAPRPRWWQRRATRVLAGLAAGSLLLFVAVAEYFLHNLEPIVRKRLVQTLSESFNSPVELDALHISLFRGIEVHGEGLRVPYGFTSHNDPKARVGPLLSVQHFRFRTTLRALLHHTTHIDEFRAEDVEIHIPPHDQRGALFGAREGRLPADPTQPRLRPRIAFTVTHIVNDRVKLFIEPDTPGKQALEFNIRHLDLNQVRPDLPAAYEADLVNAKPRGNIHSTGHLGPWVSDDPRETPVDGDYTFQDADLSTIPGIGGTLEDAGHFGGKFDGMTVDGASSVPDFWLDTAHHPMPLRTRYHALVDGTTGDLTLTSIQARLGHSDFTTAGKVVKTPHGHDITLDIDVPHAEVADFLQLAVKTTPPLMRGSLTMKGRLHIPAGPVRVPLKMELRGRFGISAVHFANAKFQDRLDGLSARAQGHPEEAKSVSNDQHAEAASHLSAAFVLEHGLLTATDVQYTVPGAVVAMNGVYSMDGNVFEFKGHVRTEATASQMVGGWRGLLLKPLDGFLKKNNAGLELPIQVSGTAGDPHFGIALQGADESTGAMAQDLKDRRPAGGKKAEGKSGFPARKLPQP